MGEITTGYNVTNYVEIMVPLKYLSIFWKTLKMPLINCEINLMLSRLTNCNISSNAVNQATNF